MDKATVFTKTAKGITQVNQKSASLSKDLMKVLKLIDGKSNFGQLMEKADLDKMQLEKALNMLAKDGFARVFQTRKEEADPFAGEDDFDFTAPGKLATPASTQRVIPGAANDISELVRQQEKADADKKQREQAHEAARVKAKSEAEGRARAEAEAKARQQAEQQAMEQARRAKEAADRAKAELDAKMREEAARQQSLAAQQAKFTAEQRAKEEEESRRLAELRVKAEREAKALAEARARAEAEAAAMAKARAEADAIVKRKAAEATEAEQQMKARLKEEIEARIRSEMEELLRNEIEEKTRDEMKAQILAEARLAARAELDERLQDEREAIARAGSEARVKAEKDATARAEMESKKRAEAEARAAAEAEARLRAEDEARTLRAQAEEHARRAKEVEARAHAEADARAREQQEASKRIEAERQGKYEADARAKIEVEERERRERELSATIEAERKAKEEAEMRARIETRARETIAEDTRAKVQAEIEGDMTKRAEIEGKAQARAYMEAKAKAELDEDERIRADQARKAREIADVLRTRVESDEVAPESKPGAPRRRRPARRGSLLRPIIFGLIGLVVLGVVLLHVVPLRPYTVKVERTLSTWLGDDVSITSMTFRLYPSPHLKIDSIAVGKLLDAKADTGKVFVDLGTLFGDRLAIKSIELDNVKISNEAAKRIATWARPQGKVESGGIDRITLRNVTIDVKPIPEGFTATLDFRRDGTLMQAMVNSGTAIVNLRPRDSGFELDASARQWTLPVGAPLPISDVKLKGTWSGSEIVVPEFEADAMEGKVNGTLRINWASGVKVESDLSLAKVNVQPLMAAFTKSISLTGRLDGNFAVASEGPSLDQLFAAPRVQGKFRVGEGSISNVDLVAVMQSDTAGQRAGVTKFAELTGEMSAADSRSSYRNVALQGGVLRGNGAIDVGNNGALAGHLALEIRSQVAQDRGAFAVSGTVQRPIIKRGN